MALLNLDDDDPWLLEYESCEKLQREIMEQFVVRNKENHRSETYARLSAKIRQRLKQYNNEVNQLKEKLGQIAKVRSITYDEIERRARNVDALKSKSIQMEKMFNDYSSRSYQERSLLLGDPEWGSRDDELLGAESTSVPTSTAELRLEKERMLQDQESGLENLAKIIARQKNIAQTINSEVDLQNDIIDDLGEHVGRTDVRMNAETSNITALDHKDKTCIYWVTIVLLFISIIVVFTAF